MVRVVANYLYLAEKMACMNGIRKHILLNDPTISVFHPVNVGCAVDPSRGLICGLLTPTWFRSAPCGNLPGKCYGARY